MKVSAVPTPRKNVYLSNSDIARAFPGAELYREKLVIACQARCSVGVLKPLTELYSAVRVLIGMCNRQLLQSRGTFTAHTDMVHMGRFGSVWTLRRCGQAMLVTGVVVVKFHPVSYGGCFRLSFVLAPVSKAFGYQICFTKVKCFSL